MGASKKRRRPSGGDAEAPETQLAQEASSKKKQRAPEEKSTIDETAPKTQEKPSKQLFIRSLPSTVTQDSLTEYFSQSYPIKHAVLVCDPVTKKSKGYGFVAFADLEDAQRVKEELHGSEFEGQKIRVDYAEHRHRAKDADTTAGGSAKKDSTQLNVASTSGRGAKSEEFRPPPKLIIRNLPWSIKEPEQLAKLFQMYGKVKLATIPKGKGGLQSGFGFVVLRGYKNAQKAMEEVNGKVVDGRPIAVDWAVQKDIWDEAQHEKDAQEEAEQPKEERDENGDIGEQSIMLDAEGDDEDEDEEAGSEAALSVGSNLEDVEDDEDASEDEDHSSTLFVRNVPYTATDDTLYEHFKSFGPVRYARMVVDPSTDRPRGTAFVCFYRPDDADSCLRQAPRPKEGAPSAAGKKSGAPAVKFSVLQDELADPSGRFTIENRVLHVSRAVNRDEAVKLTERGTSLRDTRDRDKRRLYLLAEGTVSPNDALYKLLSPTEIAMREASAKQRKTIIQNNPSLHLSLTRLSIRNIPRTVTSKDLKALAREAVVGFAKDVKADKRLPLSKEELARGGEEMKRAEHERKVRGKGIVKQAKVVFEGREGGKVTEDSGAGRSRGYGFIEYTSHRWALMGLRWLNGHSIAYTVTEKQPKGRREPKSQKKRLIVEFAIENAQVVARRKEMEQKSRERSRAGNVKESKQAGTEFQKNGTRKSTQAGTRNVKNGTGTSKPMRGTKRKRADTKDQSNGVVDGKATKKDDSKTEEEQLAKRQRIITQKRMQRRTKKKNARAVSK
ncbi:MAG: hypothetical protein M1823_001650 [Watsoniomyces obsoletus]|nr:MAG: hypothetical protein M1823_001650 [Watsoniomyces obsoletus]